jgi:hypothetical protein
MDDREFYDSLRTPEEKNDEWTAAAEEFIRLRKTPEQAEPEQAQEVVEKTSGAKAPSMNRIRQVLRDNPTLRSAVISGLAGGAVGTAYGAASSPKGQRLSGAARTGLTSAALSAGAGALGQKLTEKLAYEKESCLAKAAAIFGAHTPDEVEHGEIPYKLRKELFQEYVKQKAKETPTGYLKGTLGGAGIGAGVGGLIGLLGGSRGAGIGALGGGALGGLTGAALAASDKNRVQEAQQTEKSKKYDRGLASAVVRLKNMRDTAEWMNQERRHQELLSSFDKRASRSPLCLALVKLGYRVEG